MTPSQFDAALRAFCRRQPFRAFLLEFVRGNQLLIGHPEAIGPKGDIYVMRFADGGFVVFAAESVSRLFDTPISATT